MATSRLATLNDLPALKALEEDRAGTGVSWVMCDEEWRSRVADNRVLVAELDSSVVGYLSFFWMGPAPWIEIVWLFERHRRQGLGRAMLAVLEELARSRGQFLIFSSSTVGEEGPRAWHRAIGFRECGIFVADPDEGDADLIYRKSLQAE